MSDAATIHERMAEVVERVTELERRQELLLVAIEAGALAIARLTDALVNVETYLQGDPDEPATDAGDPAAEGGEA